MTTPSPGPTRLRVAIVAPVNLPSFASHLHSQDASLAASQPTGNGAAPTALAIALAEAGHDVLIATAGAVEQTTVYRGDRMTVIQVPQPASARAAVLSLWRGSRTRLREAILSWAPDVVHAHWTYEYALAACATRLPAVVTVRDAPFTVVRYQPDIYRLARLCLALRFRLLSSRTRLAAVSPYMAAMWRREMVDRREMVILPNIALIDRRPRAARASSPVLVEVADAGPRKNVAALLDAFQLVRTAYPEATLRVIGDGLGDSDPLAQAARQTGAADGVIFLGHQTRDETQRHLAEAWVHVHASLEETLGNTLIEAMTLGTPVVAGVRSGAVPWVLGDGSNGLLVDVSSPREIARTLTRLIASDTERRRLSAAGRAAVAERFSRGAIVRMHEELYRTLVGAPV